MDKFEIMREIEKLKQEERIELRLWLNRKTTEEIRKRISKLL